MQLDQVIEIAHNPNTHVAAAWIIFFLVAASSMFMMQQNALYGWITTLVFYFFQTVIISVTLFRLPRRGRSRRRRNRGVML